MDVVWTSPARKSFSETLYYVRLRNGNAVARKVWQMIREQVKLLPLNPHLGKVDPELSSSKYQIRFIIVNKRSKVYYFIEKEVLYIALVRDTRQDIRSLKEILVSLF